MWARLIIFEGRKNSLRKISPLWFNHIDYRPSCKNKSVIPPLQSDLPNMGILVKASGKERENFLRVLTQKAKQIKLGSYTRPNSFFPSFLMQKGCLYVCSQPLIHLNPISIWRGTTCAIIELAKSRSPNLGPARWGVRLDFLPLSHIRGRSLGQMHKKGIVAYLSLPNP